MNFRIASKSIYFLYQTLKEFVIKLLNFCTKWSLHYLITYRILSWSCKWWCRFSPYALMILGVMNGEEIHEFLFSYMGFNAKYGCSFA
jgi:hypothetical protein